MIGTQTEVLLTAAVSKQYLNWVLTNSFEYFFVINISWLTPQVRLPKIPHRHRLWRGKRPKTLPSKLQHPRPKKGPATEKNSKRIAAGKATAQKTKLACEAQKIKTFEEAATIIANNKTATGRAEPAPEPTTGRPVGVAAPEKPD